MNREFNSYLATHCYGRIPSKAAQAARAASGRNSHVDLKPASFTVKRGNGSLHMLAWHIGRFFGIA